jgi:hypothetical protein
MPRMSTILNRLVSSMRGGLGSTGLLGVLAVSNSGELRRQIRYLKAENDVLRSKIAGPIRLTPAERTRLVKLAKPVGRAVGELVLLVKPDTMLRWVNGSRPKKQRRSPRKSGRPRTPERVRAYATASTGSPTEDWTTVERARFVEAAKRSAGPPRAIIIRDCDDGLQRRCGLSLRMVRGFSR